MRQNRNPPASSIGHKQTSVLTEITICKNSRVLLSPSRPLSVNKTLCTSVARVRCTIFPGLAHKRLIKALQTYLHCKGLPLNTSQGLINVLFKSCAPITNWLEPSTSSITQKRPLQIKIHMIYTWKTLKGISSLLISHKCFKHPNFCSWFEEKKKKKCWRPVSACVSVCVRESVCVTQGRGDSFGVWYVHWRQRNTHLSYWESISMRQKHSVKYNSSVKCDKFIWGRFYFSDKRNNYKAALRSSSIKNNCPYRQITLLSECSESINTLMQY